MAPIQTAGRSRWVRAISPPSSAPWPRPFPRSAPIDARTPSTIGLNSVASVQIAAIPMVPAPIKRACELQTEVPKLASVAPAGIGVIAVSHGTATPQVSTRPSSMASPPTMPTRYPAPTNASENPIDSRTTDAPAASHALAPSASTRSPPAAKLNRPAATPPASRSASPVACRVSPGAWLALPTRRISAAATPSGYGRSLFTTIA
ncbi:hypothetical protein D3C81_1113550 [compost metagenome]